MMKKIYLAGGCFWGLEQYMSVVKGVEKTQVGYANGVTENPTYEEVCSGVTGHAETVEITYNEQLVSLAFLLWLFFDVIDPLSVNRQGNDVGSQYRSGIYYIHKEDAPVISREIKRLSDYLGQKTTIEVESLRAFYLAEEEHQKYLEKHPGGYCHIGQDKIERAAKAVVDPSTFEKQRLETLRNILPDLSYRVTMENATERPFSFDFSANGKGIYVDITTGEPLFSSEDLFESGCGWPSFSNSIDPNVVKYKEDLTYGMERIEVRSRVGDAHLGHIFDDGPVDRGGLRFCINGAALRFIPLEEMSKNGYGNLIEPIFGPLTP